MRHAPVWFLQLLRWYVLLPLTTLVVTAVPLLPGAGLAGADPSWQEGLALLFTVLAYVVLFSFADGARRSALAPDRSHLPWAWVLTAIVTTITCLALGAWVTPAPTTAAPSPGLAGAFTWCRAMVLAGMVSPAVDLELLARRILDERLMAAE